MPPNWNHRYRANLEKIKSGSIFEVAEVVRNLATRDRQKGLSTGEKKMLENARRILLSELVLAKNSNENQMSELLDNYLS
jgi:CarD family transcriptional regulator